MGFHVFFVIEIVILMRYINDFILLPNRSKNHIPKTMVFTIFLT